MRGLESKTASTILFSVLIFLIFINGEARSDKEFCSYASSCGEIRNISYPFRLKGDPSGCGDPDYELSCVNNKTILEISPGKFYVTSISYDDQTLRLVDANFADVNDSCSLPSGSVVTTGGFLKDIRFRGVSDPDSRFRFVNCSRNISSVPEAANHTAVPCLTRNRTYVYAVYDGEYSYYSPQPSCSVISLAPVGLRKGVTKDCALKGKPCVVTSRVKPITYKCERENKELTSTEGKLIIAAIVVGGLIALGVAIAILVFVIRRCQKRRNAADNTVKSLPN
ncbi:hypothetical protein C1H46_027426 [Malus baccata]|uniref:Wall-associated receptor kinase galacturonan-binding domain-containing protein n=1 Tax=Malus baccata TaxID=106549 RepID=A0A540LKN8_MALBA|nr:hypothetical protein C1H46_027426 [Malus baccata]